MNKSNEHKDHISPLRTQSQTKIRIAVLATLV